MSQEKVAKLQEEMEWTKASKLKRQQSLEKIRCMGNLFNTNSTDFDRDEEPNSDEETEGEIICPEGEH